MKMRVLARCSVRGKSVEPGTVIDVSNADALNLLSCDRGEALDPHAIAEAVKESNRVAAELERQSRSGFVRSYAA
jgi:hypothetical protein